MIKVKDKNSDAVAFTYSNAKNQPGVMVYFGKQKKPTVSGIFRTLAARDEAIARAFKSRQAYLEYKREKREKELAMPRGVEVGDIFYTSWGYEQTNLDFYQVVGLVGKVTVKLRKIAKDTTEQFRDAGYAVALPGEFVKDEIIRVQMRGGRGSIDGHILTKWDGKPKYWSSYY